MISGSIPHDGAFEPLGKDPSRDLKRDPYPTSSGGLEFRLPRSRK